MPCLAEAVWQYSGELGFFHQHQLPGLGSAYLTELRNPDAGNAEAGATMVRAVRWWLPAPAGSESHCGWGIRAGIRYTSGRPRRAAPAACGIPGRRVFPADQG